MADPGLNALILWAVLPASLAIAALCFTLWRSRRHWVVLEGRVLTRPGPQDGAAPCTIALPQPDGTQRVVALRILRGNGPPPVGAEVTLCHPPGEPEALQTGTPGPLLAGAVAGALMAMLCLAIVAGY